MFWILLQLKYSSKVENEWKYKKFFKAHLNWFLLWHSSFIWEGRLLTWSSVICSLLIYWQIRYWQMYFWFSPSNDVYLRVHLKIIPIIDHKNKSEYIYWDCNGNIFKFLKCSLHESLPLIPTMILIILFCSLKLMLQWWEFPQNINP